MDINECRHCMLTLHSKCSYQVWVPCKGRPSTLLNFHQENSVPRQRQFLHQSLQWVHPCDDWNSHLKSLPNLEDSHQFLVKLFMGTTMSDFLSEDSMVTLTNMFEAVVRNVARKSDSKVRVGSTLLMNPTTNLLPLCKCCVWRKRRNKVMKYAWCMKLCTRIRGLFVMNFWGFLQTVLKCLFFRSISFQSIGL